MERDKMFTSIKKTFIATVATLTLAGVSQATDQHNLTTHWSSDLSVSENFNRTVNSVNAFCAQEAREINRREMAFRKRFIENCKSQLMQDYVAKTGSVEIQTLYAELKRNS